MIFVSSIPKLSKKYIFYPRGIMAVGKCNQYFLFLLFNTCFKTLNQTKIQVLFSSKLKGTKSHLPSLFISLANFLRATPVTQPINNISWPWTTMYDAAHGTIFYTKCNKRLEQTDSLFCFLPKAKETYLLKLWSAWLQIQLFFQFQIVHQHSQLSGCLDLFQVVLRMFLHNDWYQIL